jgi:hypothetical protein
MKQDEPDTEDRRSVVLSTLVVIATVLLCGAIVRVITPRAPRAHARAATITAHPFAPSGVEDASLFSTTVAGERRTRESRERLQTYGWVDRTRGIVHIPIEVAMQLYIANEEYSPQVEPTP